MTSKYTIHHDIKIHRFGIHFSAEGCPKLRGLPRGVAECPSAETPEAQREMLLGNPLQLALPEEGWPGRCEGSLPTPTTLIPWKNSYLACPVPKETQSSAKLGA